MFVCFCFVCFVYRLASKIVHPDKCQLPQAHRAQQLLNAAFDVLGQKESRNEYSDEVHKHLEKAEMRELNMQKRLASRAKA